MNNTTLPNRYDERNKNCKCIHENACCGAFNWKKAVVKFSNKRETSRLKRKFVFCIYNLSKKFYILSYVQEKKFNKPHQQIVNIKKLYIPSTR